jgi:hypothetical protein
VQGQRQENQEWNDANDSQSEVNHKRRQAEKNTLKRVEAHEAVLVVRLNHEKNNRGNKGSVSEHSGDIVRHACRI